MSIKIFSYSLFCIMVAFAGSIVYPAYGQDQGLTQKSGLILNTGTIKTKGKSLTQEAGSIENKQGRIIIEGQATLSQDTLKGRVEYIMNDEKTNQYIPQKVYEDIYFSGNSKKMLTDTSHQLISLIDFTSDSTALFSLNRAAEIYAKGKVKHNGNINPDRSYGAFRMNGVDSQLVQGKGSFQEIELNNSNGADVINGGGFKVNAKLELTKGELRNSKDNNFSMRDSTLIVRNTAGTIREEPELGKNISVKYTGSGSITSGPELPKDPKVLKTLSVENSGGVTLAKSVTVNDSLRMGANIRTKNGTDTNLLTLTSKNNPEFINPDAEVDGSIRRTDVTKTGEKILFNNQHTYAQFADEAARGKISDMTFTVNPGTLPTPDDGQRVRRVLEVNARDTGANIVDTGFSLDLGYGWRNSADASINETNNLNIQQIVLQRISDNTWLNAGTSTVPTIAGEWAFAKSERVQKIGVFSFGYISPKILALNARILLEGPYRNGSMALDLRDDGTIPTTPPNIYPYNLDPNRAFINVQKIPENAVDWVVVELRTEQTGGERSYQTCFVGSDGRLLGLDGKSSVAMPDVDTGSFYIAIRHRTHLAVMTSEPYEFSPKTVQSIVDFTTGQGILGGSGALKPIGLNANGSLVFGMIAGDANGDGKVDQADYEQTWNERNSGEPYLNADTDMNGEVTTKDANVNWNNRGKETVVPK